MKKLIKRILANKSFEHYFKMIVLISIPSCLILWGIILLQRYFGGPVEMANAIWNDPIVLITIISIIFISLIYNFIRMMIMGYKHLLMQIKDSIELIKSSHKEILLLKKELQDLKK